jgi:phosphoglycerol transferase MdoB-like AlkP superfamily enzyme
MSYLKPFKGLLLALAFLLGYYFLTRLLFLGWNYQFFTFHSPAEFVRIFWWGSRMDLSAIAVLNAPVFLLFFITQYLPRRAWPQLFIRATFILLNALGMALNVLDAGYFRFSKHRSNIDLWYVLGDSAGSFGSILRLYLPLVLFFGFSLWWLIWLAKKTFPAPPFPQRPRLLLPAQVLLLLLLFFAARGWQTRPLIPATPLLDIEAGQLPLAQNSFSTFSYSLVNRERQMTPKHYFPPDELRRIVSTRHLLAGPPPENPLKKNVVLIILESFARSYVLPGDPQKAHTPFLDSLIRKSLFFPHSFANGFTSNQGIVALLGGLPALTDEPFFYSAYANTPLYSIGNILKEKGYNTNFFMGAGRDHFGFGKFARMAGLDHTYWQNDFNDDRFYDGNWGIFDEPFLQFGAHVLAVKPQPFFATFFTISAHPPYTIPAADSLRFRFPGQTPAQRSISYTDEALRQFFSASREMPWFRNTLFVFCADHWLDPYEGRTPFSFVNVCSIPIFIYDPAHDTGRARPTVAGQVDLAPTVLDLLGYRGAYSGFGRSLLDTTIPPADRYVINRLGDNYQLITDEYILGYDPVEERSGFLYRYATDSALTHNLRADPASDSTRTRLERLLRANIQAYRQALTQRSLN